MPETLVRCDNVSKKFCRDLKRSLWYGVKDSAAELFWNRKRSAGGHPGTGDIPSSDPVLRTDEFWATHNITFEVNRGECLGLIGRNGAGKTTLLKMLNGLIKPDAGRIEMRGRVGALIALGAGFNRILSGRENIFINGSILGLSKRQISDRVDEIVEFAELEDSIDAPVRTYSSGMQVRLGFAVAAVLVKPDILLLDEVLAVGDMSFRSRCFNAIGKIQKQSAVIFVSHQMPQVARICTHSVLLHKGKIATDTRDVPANILEYATGTDSKPHEHREFENSQLSQVQIVSGTYSCTWPAAEGTVAEQVRMAWHSSFSIRIRAEMPPRFSRLNINLAFTDSTDRGVVQFYSSAAGFEISNTTGKIDVIAEIPGRIFNAGVYWLSVVITSDDRLTVLTSHTNVLQIQFTSDFTGFAPMQMAANWRHINDTNGGSGS